MKLDKKQIVLYSIMGILAFLLVFSVFIGKRNDSAEKKYQAEKEKQEQLEQANMYEYSSDNNSESDSTKDNNENNSNDDSNDNEDNLDDIDDTNNIDEDDIGYDEETIESYDFEKQIKKKIGKKEYKKIMKNAKKAMDNYTKGEYSGWEMFSNEKMVEEIKNGKVELPSKEDDFDYELYPTEQTHDDDVIIGATITSDNKETSSVKMIFKEDEDNEKYLLNSIVKIWEYEE